jgi:hypothetical protein
VVLAVNKMDTPALREAVAGEFFKMGFRACAPSPPSTGKG